MDDDIPQPQRWVDGRCLNNTTTETNPQEPDSDENEGTFSNNVEIVDVDDDDGGDHFEITKINDYRYTTSFHVSKHYFGYIIGKKGATKIQIEEDTKTQIKIPKLGLTGDIVISGGAASNVKAARKRINNIVISSRSKQRCTHFISVPMNNEDIRKRFIEFKERVLRECPCKGLEESIFNKPMKLHLTFGVMCLMDKVERAFATTLLTEAKEQIIMPLLEQHLPLRIRLKGLSYMKDDPQQIHVLYGCVQEEGSPSGLLQNLADKLYMHFFNAGYVKEEYGRNSVKLHVTLINTAFRTRNGLDDKKQGYKREPLDGSLILEKFTDYDFGVQTVTDVHLSQMNSAPDGGYYKSTCVVSCMSSSTEKLNN